MEYETDHLKQTPYKEDKDGNIYIEIGYKYKPFWGIKKELDNHEE